MRKPRDRCQLGWAPRRVARLRKLEDASDTRRTNQICRPLQSAREMEISCHKGTGGGTIGADSPESHRGAGSNASQRPVLDDQLSGPGGHQRRHAQRSVG
ncbi:unnamed protein product [Ascophyllum nodosum]